MITLDELSKVKIKEDSLVTGRTCIIGQSGSGKSYSVSVICEELCKSGVGFCIIDTEGEYQSLKQSFNLVLGGYGNDCDLSLRDANVDALTNELISSNVPFILDVSDSPDQRGLVDSFCRSLYTAASRLRTPYLLIIEEADIFCPQQGETLSVISEISRRGRKRGLGLMIVTQRPALVDKTILSQCNFQVIGKLTIEGDLEAVKPFFNRRSEVSRLPSLSPGEFFIKDRYEARLIKFKQRVTEHKSRTPVIRKRSSPVINDVVSKISSIKPLTTDGMAVDKAFNDEEIIKLAYKLKKRGIPLVRSKEEVSNIKLNYLPLIELSIKVVKSSLFRKKHESMIICFDGLKPVAVNERYEDLFDLSGIKGLSPKAVDILVALNRSKGMTVKKLSKKIKLAEERVKEELRLLMDKKHVTKSDKEGVDEFLSLYDKRIPRLKTMAVNSPKPSINCDAPIKPLLDIDLLRSVIKSINPKAEIVESKTIYYPFYEITFRNAREELRTININGVTGRER